MSDSPSFNRVSDMENLRKIPTIETKMDFIIDGFKDIKETVKENAKCVPVLQSNISWLTNIVWRILVPIFLAFISAVLYIIFKKP